MALLSSHAIRDVRAICTAPDGIRLVVVKVDTTEPGLYGLGCATFTQRPLAVVTAVEEYLRAFLIGRDVHDIEDIWQASFVSSYWRSGPVLNNAMSGVDMALWDIKGKIAGLPVYQLLGGKCRHSAALYAHASGRDFDEVELLHDIHERIAPIQAIQLAKDLEPYNLFFLEDPLAPEDIGYFTQLRHHTTVPIAMGE